MTANDYGDMYVPVALTRPGAGGPTLAAAARAVASAAVRRRATRSELRDVLSMLGVPDTALKAPQSVPPTQVHHPPAAKPPSEPLDASTAAACKRGHLKTPKNRRRRPNGTTECRLCVNACERERAKARRRGAPT